MDTMLLDVSTWDLVLDASGNIAIATNPYSLAQDAASAVKTFAGEEYYDTTVGVPFFERILGKFPPVSLMKARFVQAAFTVPGVVGVQCFITGFEGRVVTGQVQIEDELGRLGVAAL